jgi:16S rRNA (uracil1498-N3)-methyltransferase
MPRFFLPPDAWQAETSLGGDEARHLAQVLRIRPGQRVTVFDGGGRRAAAEIVTVSRDRTILRLGETVVAPTPQPRIELAQAIPKGKNMDWIVQKAVELGVCRIQPLVTRNTVVQPGDGKAEKWRRVALEACKQCGQDRLPEISEPAEILPWLEGASDAGTLKVIASLASGTQPLREILRQNPHPTQVTLLVGPEGDFNDEETRRALDSGFLPASLGTNILRAETAALFGVAALRYEFG